MRRGIVQASVFWYFLSCSVLFAFGEGGPSLRASDRTLRSVPGRGSYTVVVSSETYGMPSWRRVVEALRDKHRAGVLIYPGRVDSPELLVALRAAFPRYACFVARPEEADRPFVCRVHRLTRKLDEDPYTDVLWGILTGYDAANALSIARRKRPLVCRRALGGTSVPMGVFEAVRWYSETEKGVMWEKKPGGKPQKKKCPPDTTKSLVDDLNRWKPDLFVTSGHATERDWQIGYSYKNGQFRCRKGRIVGIDLAGKIYPVDSPNAKVYLPVGNCLIGRIPDRECMALAYMNSCGVTQMVAYVVSTWFGFGGWGVFDYFFAQPGRFTAAESFYCNHQALLWKLYSKYPKAASATFKKYDIERDRTLLSRFARAHKVPGREALGLLWDRDTVVFYGDPAWEARLKKGESSWDQSLEERNGVYTVTIRVRRTVRPKRPPIVLFPRRLGNIDLLEGKEFEPVITDNFLLLGKPETLEAGKTYRVRFRAAPVGPYRKVRRKKR